MNPTLQQGSTTIACLNCRERHVKCDGNLGGCSRCMAADVSCYYLPSRRGRKREAGASQPDDPGFSPSALDISSLLPISWPASNSLSSWPSPSRVVGTEDTTLSCPCPPSTHTSAPSSLVTSYYLNFHHAHPFVLPERRLIQSQTPRYLIDTVELIGLHYISPSSVTIDGITALETTVREATLSLEKVQALLLLSITQHAYVLPLAARRCLGEATERSLQLGLHRRDISDAEMDRDPARAESLRRTWWEVYVVDALLAAMQVEGSLHFATEETPDVPVPCDEETYEAGCFDLEPVSARQLNSDRHILYSENDLPSPAYRVEAAIILRRCLAASQRSIDALDAGIAAWFHRLPDEKRAILRNDGEVDQMLFQAVMLMHCASIYLHFPRSHLIAHLPATRQLFCSTAPGLVANSPTPQLHTSKVLAGAIGLSKLGALTISVVHHSPFFCCTLVLSCIVQMAVRSGGLLGPSDGLESFLGLNFGVLKSMAGIWRIAAMSRTRVRDASIEVENAGDTEGR